MDYHENIFEGLILNGQCPHNYACITSSIRDLCSEGYDPNADAIECLACESRECDFAEPRGSLSICKCPLRNYVVKHFDQWTADISDRIKRLKLDHM